MSRRVHLIIASFVLMAGSSANAHPQGGRLNDATGTNGATQPAQGSVPSQSGAQNSTANPSSGSSVSPQSTTKKVWTNDDVSAEDPNAGISTVGKATNGAGKRTVAARPVSANGRNAKLYQGEIARLQAKIPVFDSQIADLQAALDGKAAGDGKRSARPYGVKMDDWSRELAELRQKREETLDQINALRDQARHSGVAPNAIP